MYLFQDAGGMYWVRYHGTAWRLPARTAQVAMHVVGRYLTKITQA